MSLSAREEHTLESIKERLAGSDPTLAALLAMFTRLVAGEDMPIRERIPVGGRPAARVRYRPRPLHRGKAHQRMGRLGRGLGFQQAALLLWLMISVLLVTVALVLNRGSGHGGCAAAWPTVCAQPAAAHNPSRTAPKKITQWVHPPVG